MRISDQVTLDSLMTSPQPTAIGLQGHIQAFCYLTVWGQSRAPSIPQLSLIPSSLHQHFSELSANCLIVSCSSRGLRTHQTRPWSCLSFNIYGSYLAKWSPFLMISTAIKTWQFSDFWIIETKLVRVDGAKNKIMMLIWSRRDYQRDQFREPCRTEPLQGGADSPKVHKNGPV